MTNPTLSISTTKQIGRLYQLPGGDYPKSISSSAALKGYNANQLFPSITNVIGILDKKLEGYAIYMMQKALREGASISEAAKAPDTYRDYASERGSSVHLLIEQYIDRQQGLSRESARRAFPPQYMALPAAQEVKRLEGIGYMKAFLNFCNDYQPEFLQQETTVYGSTTGGDINYAGTTDFIANINGIKTVGDWKCTSKLHPGSVARQLSAVRNASKYYNEVTDSLEEWDGDTIQRAAAIRLCSDGTYEIKSANLEAGWESFKNLRKEWPNQAFGDAGMLTDLED